ncbi:SEC-C metal-binding domain-containing protein [Nonomuraea sp. NPDC050404]|uniref:SEC-C metal-binding domain-containing protein n=1 Tax=Nonomuraea sp. NPDC050404 TaxID=3155783 RepID=UPI0033E71FA6
MIEKLGGNDPCPCGSGRRFPPLLPPHRPVRRHARPLLRPRLRSHPRTRGGGRRRRRWWPGKAELVLSVPSGKVTS